jgi:GTP-binding protein
LFNAVLDRREAIVAREAGTTRDSISARASHGGRDFWLVDTAGIKDPEDDFEFTIQEQVAQAADSADVIWVVVEADIPVTEEDRRVAKMALRSRKPVFLVINKTDRAKGQDLGRFDRLGIRTMVGTSVTQGRGIGRLLDGLVEVIPQAKIGVDDDRLRLAIVGRPNAGKSQLFNALAKKQQAVVADRAGTTRDVNRTVVRYKNKEVELLDTAGIRRSGKIGTGIERFSVIRALAAIEEADVCLLLMDVGETGVQLDQKIAGMVKEAGKGLVLVVSKWDIAEDKDAYTRDGIAARLKREFDFVPWAPLAFTSSVTGRNVTKLFDVAMEIKQARKLRIPTPELNKWLRQAVDEHPPAGLKDRQPKLNYMVQETDNPTPAFKIFASQSRYVHWSYRRYLERRLREAYGFEGTPVQLWFIEKHKAHKHGASPTKEDKPDKADEEVS